MNLSKEEFTVEDLKEIYGKRLKIKKSSKGNEYKINEGKAIGIFKEKYIKIMLINNPKEALKELDKLEKVI